MGAYIPKTLRQAEKWLLWRKEITPGSTAPKKIPYSGKPYNNFCISPTDTTAWTTYEEANTKLYNSGAFDGLGFALSASDNITAIDLDECINEAGELSPLASNIVERFKDTYIEESQSGRGLHIFCYADFKENLKHPQIEIYTHNRYIAMTGNAWNRNELKDKTAEVMILYEKFRSKQPTAPRTAGSRATPQKFSDDEIIKHASRSKNQGQKFIDLFYNSNWSKYYDSQSSADIWLLNKLWYYSGNKEQTTRLFYKSELGKRKKAQRSDYVIERTLKKVMDNTAPASYFINRNIKHGSN